MCKDKHIFLIFPLPELTWLDTLTHPQPPSPPTHSTHLQSEEIKIKENQTKKTNVGLTFCTLSGVSVV